MQIKIADAAAMRMEGASYQAIADVYGVTRQGVQLALRRLADEVKATVAQCGEIAVAAAALKIPLPVAEAALNGFGGVESQPRKQGRSAWREEAIQAAREALGEREAFDDDEGTSLVETLSKRFGRKQGHMRAILREAGVKLSKRASGDEKDDILRLRRDGATYARIAEETGWSITMVEKVCHEGGLAGQERQARQGSVSASDRERIIAMSTDGKSQREISEATGWSQATISNIVRKRDT